MQDLLVISGLVTSLVLCCYLCIRVLICREEGTMKSNLIYKSPVNQQKLFRFRENSKHTAHKEKQQYFLYH